MTGGQFPFSSVTEVLVDTAKPIIAPSYILFPERTEQEQIASAKRAYNL